MIELRDDANDHDRRLVRDARQRFRSNLAARRGMGMQDKHGKDKDET